MWGAIIGAGISVGGKLWSDRKAKKNQQGGGYDQAGEMYRKQSEMGDMFMQSYKDTWQPFEQEYADLLSKGVDEETYVGRAGADVQQSFDKGQDMQERQASRMGIDPSSGRFQQMMENSQYARGLAEVGARGDARMQARDMNLRMKGEGANMGRGMLQGASGAYSGAGAGFMGQAGMEAEGARGQGQFYGDMFQGLGGGFQDWYDNRS